MSSPQATELFRGLQTSFSPADRERLSRILDRCRADLEHPLDAIGTGSQVTLKRGTALKVVLEDADMAAIVAATSLPEARVMQVMENVQAYGFAALYPWFPEALPLQKPLDEKGLWKVIKEYLGKSPSACSVADEKWRPSTAADYLVHTGAAADVSVGQIADIIGKYKDRNQGIEIQGVSIKKEYPFEFKEASHESQRRLFPFEPGFLFLVLLIVVLGWVFLFAGGDLGIVKRILITAGFAAALITMVLMILKQSLEWWLLQKVLASTRGSAQTSLTAMQLWKRWFRRDILGAADGGRVPARSFRGICAAWLRSKAPFLNKRSKPAPQPVAPRPVNPLGTPRLTIINPRSLPGAPWDIDSISDARNVMGMSPVPTLYLWVFDAQEAQQAVFKEQGWLQIGPVHLLLNSSALPLGSLLKSRKDLLLQDPKNVDDWMASFSDGAGSHPDPGLFRQIGGRIGKLPDYVGYPLHTPVCTDGSWEYALHRFASRCDLAVVNLSGYDPSHPGLEYEIRHLLSGGPPRKFVFMYDHATDADAVIESVLDVWNGMEPPGSVPELIFLRTENAMNIGYQEQFEARSAERAVMKQYYEKKAENYVPIAARLVAYLIASGHLGAGESRILRAGA